MSRGRIPPFALLGLLWALALRALGGDWVPRIFSSWALWLLAGAGAGCLALVAARPTRGWHWLWRPLLVGLSYGVSGLILLLTLWPLPNWLAQVFAPFSGTRSVPVIVARFTGGTQTDAQFAMQIVWAIAFVVLIGATFCLLANLRRHSPA